MAVVEGRLAAAVVALLCLADASVPRAPPDAVPGGGVRPTRAAAAEAPEGRRDGALAGLVNEADEEDTVRLCAAEEPKPTEADEAAPLRFGSGDEGGGGGAAEVPFFAVAVEVADLAPAPLPAAEVVDFAVGFFFVEVLPLVVVFFEEVDFFFLPVPFFFFFFAAAASFSAASSASDRCMCPIAVPTDGGTPAICAAADGSTMYAASSSCKDGA